MILRGYSKVRMQPYRQEGVLVGYMPEFICPKEIENYLTYKKDCPKYSEEYFAVLHNSTDRGITSTKLILNHGEFKSEKRFRKDGKASKPKIRLVTCRGDMQPNGYHGHFKEQEVQNVFYTFDTETRAIEIVYTHPLKKWDGTPTNNKETTMVKYPSDDLPLEQLLNIWPADIKGSLLRRMKAKGCRHRLIGKFIQEEFLGNIVPIREPKPKLERVEDLFKSDLCFGENGLLQAIRSVYKKKYLGGSVPKTTTDWSLPDSEQNISDEAAFYLRHWDKWTINWKPPSGLSLIMIKHILLGWADGISTDLDYVEKQSS